jgi:hemerythrin superfamily protein
MEFTIFERLLLLRALPAEGNIITLRIVRDLRNNLSLTEEEIKDQEVKQDETTQLIKWKNPDYKKEIVIGEKAMDIIAESLTKLNRENKLTMEYLPLYEKIVEKKEP